MGWGGDFYEVHTEKNVVLGKLPTTLLLVLIVAVIAIVYMIKRRKR